MIHIVNNHIENIYNCQLNFINNICFLLFKLTNKKFNCIINKKNILNLCYYHFEEITNNELKSFNDFDKLIYDNFNNLNQKLDNLRLVIKYDIINDTWSLFNINDIYCYIIIKSIKLEECLNLINDNYYLNKIKNLQIINKYAIVPYIDIQQNLIKKTEKDLDDLIENINNLSLNKKVIKNIIKKKF
jgi:hypothetical protein